MANIIYRWNPFQTLIDNRVKGEIIKPSDTNERVEFLVRAAPFFSRNFKLYRQGTTTPLKLGTDYAFAHPFDEFIVRKKRNVFGSVVLLKPFAGDVLLCDYDTIGSPFVLDEIEFVQLAANIINKPREANWEDIDPRTLPTEWPFDPHEHPMSQTYDYEEMMTALRSLLLVTTSANTVKDNLLASIQTHLAAELPQAHLAKKEHFGLDQLPNIPAATNADLSSGSGNVLVTVAVLKEALRQYRDGTLNID